VAAVFHQSLTPLIGGHRPIVVDVSQLRHLDMSGVRVLEEAHRKGGQRGQQIVLAGSAPTVHKLLGTGHVNQRTRLVESIGKALEFLQWKGRS
jgi:anti-anti-sigma factor